MPIKLKLSLSGPSGAAGAGATPSTPQAGPSSNPASGPGSIPSSRKGKTKATAEDEEQRGEGQGVQSTGNGVNRANHQGQTANTAAGIHGDPPGATEEDEVHEHEQGSSAVAGGEWPNGDGDQVPSSTESSSPYPLPPTFVHPADTPTHPASGPSGPSGPSTPSTPAASSSTPLKRPSKSKPRPSKSSRPVGRPRKSVIPPHVLSASSTPKVPPTPLPSTPTPSADRSHDPQSVKLEPGEDDDEADPLAEPLSPSINTPEANQTPYSAGTPGEGVNTPVGRGRTGAKWQRVKKPLKDLLNKIMAELRRKDEYALFEEPVQVEDFPGYLEIVGGEDKMMDLGTMQLKVDSGEYRSVDEIEADLRTLVAAAQAFNPPGTIPYNSAGRLLTHGLKHVDRARPLVRTPTPSPTRPSGSESGTPWRGRSMFSGREMTVGTDDGGYRNIEITPQNHIPEEMLSLPPNSLEALAVGWNLTGGKRVYAKRIIRGREKFVGKWRNWDYDGTRDIAEMEDVQEVFSDWRTTQGVRRMVDWMGLRKDGEWWDWGGYGGPFGQPPVPFTPFPKKPSLRTRELTTSEWGVYPQIEAEMAFLSRRTGIKDDVELLSEHLRPTQSRQPKGPPPLPNFVNMYEQAPGKTAEDWLHDVCTGDPRGEAYIRSVETFVKGAMDGAAQRRAAETGTGTGANADESAGLRIATVGIKREGGEERGHEEALSLDEFVRHHYLSGVFSSGAPQIVRETLFKLSQILRNSNIERAEPAKPAEPADHAEPAPTASSTHSALAELHGIASTVYARVAMRHLARPENPLDIAQFLRAPGEFAHQGLGGKTSVEKGLAWVGAEIERVDGMIRSGLGVQEKRAGHTNGADGVTADGTGCVIDGEAGVNGANGCKADTDALDAVDAVSDKKRKRESSPERSAGIIPKKLKPDNSVIDSVASSPLTQPPDSPRPEPDGNTAAEAEDVEVAGPQPVIPSGPPELDEFDMPKLPLPESLERLRLELVALSKFYPLAALKKVEQETAEKVLPKAVWHLMVKK